MRTSAAYNDAMSEATIARRRPAQETRRPDKLYIENNLLRIAGALFCHDQKRAATRTGEIHLNPGLPEKRITVRPDPKLGQPGPLAHKVFVALIKKHSDYGRPVLSEISFTRREIGRLIGRKDWGGTDSAQLSRALHEIHYTFVTTHFKKGTGRFVEHSFNIFPQIWIERREFESDPVEACTVMLAEPIVRSLQDEHFVCLNHSLMQKLGTIGQALYMRLFFHFANLYVRPAQHLAFQKRYQDICGEWLGGLTIHAHRSIVEHNQLGPHLRQLVATNFLSSYAITKSKSDTGLVVSFEPGPTFYEDYERFYRRRTRGETQAESQPDQRAIGEPLKLAYLFAEKRTGHPVASIAYVNSKEVTTAKQILAEIPFDEAPAFLDFALAAARETKFDVQTLGGLRQYLARYKAGQTARATAKSEKVVRDRREAERLAYDHYRRQEAISLFRSLPARERQVIEQLVERSAARFEGSLRASMRDVYRAQFTAKRHPEDIKSFEQWKAAA